MDRPDDLPLVVCGDCGRPCRHPVSRARRVGAGCWRKRRAKARAAATAATASRLPWTPQDGPSLLDPTDTTTAEALDA